MRSLEYLIQLFPDKTGKEIIEIQEQDKLEDEKEYQERNKKKLELIKDININGGYYRGQFGVNSQYFYYSFKNLFLENDRIYCDCESIVLFSGECRVTDRFNVEIGTDQYRELEKYGINFYERITKEDWEKVINYFKKSTELFW